MTATWFTDGTQTRHLCVPEGAYTTTDLHTGIRYCRRCEDVAPTTTKKGKK